MLQPCTFPVGTQSVQRGSPRLVISLLSLYHLLNPEREPPNRGLLTLNRKKAEKPVDLALLKDLALAAGPLGCSKSFFLKSRRCVHIYVCVFVHNTRCIYIYIYTYIYIYIESYMEASLHYGPFGGSAKLFVQAPSSIRALQFKHSRLKHPDSSTRDSRTRGSSTPAA